MDTYISVLQRRVWPLLLASVLLLPFQKAIANDGNLNIDNFSETVVFEHQGNVRELFITGETIRTKFFLDIYAIAHYLEAAPELDKNNFYREVLESTAAKQISMVFMRALNAEQIKESLLQGLKRNSDSDLFKSIESHVDEFIRPITTDVDKNDEFIIRWLPGGTTVSYFQGNEISSIKSEKFAKTLWSIWFSKHSVVDRKKLVQRLTTSS